VHFSHCAFGCRGEPSPHSVANDVRDLMAAAEHPSLSLNLEFAASESPCYFPSGFCSCGIVCSTVSYIAEALSNVRFLYFSRIRRGRLRDVDWPGRVPYVLILKRYWRALIGTCGAWFLYALSSSTFSRNASVCADVLMNSYDFVRLTRQPDLARCV
jgi:hypothetical protein